MTIIQEETGSNKGRYVKTMGDGSEAQLTFINAGEDLMVIDHVGVPPQFRGGGIAAQLVQHAAHEARAAGKKITPICPYAAMWFKRHPEWSDLLT